MFILHHRDAGSWWPKYVKVLESRSFCRIPKPVLGSVGDKLLVMEGVIILKRIFKNEE